MPQVINTNIASLNAQRNLNKSQGALQTSLQRLSSGMRINSAKDDAAGLAISERFTAQIRGLNQAVRNSNDGISLSQTAEGALGEVTSNLQRVRELAVQSANGVYTSEDRMQIQVEVSQLVDEINRIASHAQFNGMNMLTGNFSRDSDTIMQFQVGANMDQNERVYIGTMTAQALGIQGAQGSTDTINIETPEDSNMAIGMVDVALKKVSQQRADLGAYQNRFQMATKGVAVAAENLQAAESRIRDVDMATEMVDYVKNQILVQSNTAMLAQANNSPQSVLKLL